MDPLTLKYLWDVTEACKTILEFVKDKSLEDYLSDKMLRSAVERQMTILGEALFQADKIEPDLANKISELKKIIGFRHILIHGYGLVKAHRVWDIVHEKLGQLNADIETILKNTPV